MAALLILLLLLAGCQGMQPGPTIDPVAISQPAPVAAPLPPPVPTRPVPPPQPSGTFRAWVPPQTLDSGERIQGHDVDIPLEPPPVQAFEPVHPIPRAPRLPLVPKEKPTQGAAVPAPGHLRTAPEALQPQAPLMPQMPMGMPGMPPGFQGAPGFPGYGGR